jgi:hypothetical protein
MLTCRKSLSPTRFRWPDQSRGGCGAVRPVPAGVSTAAARRRQHAETAGMGSWRERVGPAQPERSRATSPVHGISSWPLGRTIVEGQIRRLSTPSAEPCGGKPGIERVAPSRLAPRNQRRAVLAGQLC